MKNGKAEEALAHYDKAVAELPADPAVALQSRQGPVRAVALRGGVAELMRATQSKSPALKAAAFYNLGNSYFKADSYADAIAAYSHALAWTRRHARQVEPGTGPAEEAGRGQEEAGRSKTRTRTRTSRTTKRNRTIRRSRTRTRSRTRRSRNQTRARTSKSRPSRRKDRTQEPNAAARRTGAAAQG